MMPADYCANCQTQASVVISFSLLDGRQFGWRGLAIPSTRREQLIQKAANVMACAFEILTESEPFREDRALAARCAKVAKETVARLVFTD